MSDRRLLSHGGGVPIAGTQGDVILFGGQRRIWFYLSLVTIAVCYRIINGIMSPESYAVIREFNLKRELQYVAIKYSFYLVFIKKHNKTFYFLNKQKKLQIKQKIK